MCGRPHLYGMISSGGATLETGAGCADRCRANPHGARAEPPGAISSEDEFQDAAADRPETRMSDIEKRSGDENSTGVVVKTKPRTRKPSLYKVLMLNDDYTPMEFVVHVLERFFAKNRDEATRIMMHVHRRGVGICGVYTYEVAETKVTQVMDFARQHQHPLQCTLEKE
jgi:ATP-dependent Clp protease adaptor protein ClpS